MGEILFSDTKKVNVTAGIDPSLDGINIRMWIFSGFLSFAVSRERTYYIVTLAEYHVEIEEKYRHQCAFAPISAFEACLYHFRSPLDFLFFFCGWRPLHFGGSLHRLVR